MNRPRSAQGRLTRNEGPLMASFVCSTCGESHQGLPTDHGWTLPDEVWAIPPAVRNEKARFNADLCELGGRFFMRCILELPFTQQSEYYGLGVWVEVSERDFLRYVDLYNEDGTSEPPVPGKIANAVPGYPPTLGLPVMVQFRGSTSRPSVAPIDRDHPLAIDHREGVDNRRYHEILVFMGSLRGP